MRVDILCYNALYFNYRYMFHNSTSVEIRRPARASYGTDNTFAISLVEGYEISLPFNQPKLRADISDPMTAMPENIISLANDPQNDDWVPIKHQSTMSRNVWVPSSLYWNGRSRINIPFLPYFSNCRQYGSTIPLWALMEQHSQCELVPNEETFAVGAFSFGAAPEADGCEEVVIECIYDEIFAS